LCGSFATSTQAVPHGKNGLLQAKLQAPSTHTPAPFAGALQVAPQPPQFLGSVLVNTQALLQMVWPLVQLGGDGAPRLLEVPVRTQRFVDESQTYPLRQRPKLPHDFPSKLVGSVDSHAKVNSRSNNETATHRNDAIIPTPEESNFRATVDCETCRASITDPSAEPPRWGALACSFRGHLTASGRQPGPEGDYAPKNRCPQCFRRES
jgi:hypothetical protein